MRQLLISEIFPPRTGGSGRWFWEIYQRLPREEYYVAPGETNVSMNESSQHPMIVSRLPLSLPDWGLRSTRGLRGYWRAWQAVSQVAREYRIDRLHCGRMLPEGWIAWLLKKSRGTPYLCYVHGEEASYGALSRELGWMMRRVLRGADLLIANSHNTARILREQWQVPDAKLRVLHPGVDTRQFTPAPRDREMRRRLGWDDRPVILTVGRLQTRKGHDMMLRALPAIAAQLPEVLYAIVGEGEERARLQTLIDELRLERHARLLGELQNEALTQAYQQCDLFVLPNRDIQGDIEGFGMVLLEAQACGRPVVAGDSGGTAETMQVGVTGLLLDCETPVELEQAIPTLLKDASRCRTMGEAGRQWVESRFAWPPLAEQAASLLAMSQPESRPMASHRPATASSSLPAADGNEILNP